MKALAWYGRGDVRVERVADPEIINPHDAIVKVSSTAICGSDLHLFDGYIPAMQKGDILGHEFMGEIVEVGSEVKKRKVGERVVVPFPIACGQCYYCQNDMWSLCDNTNPSVNLAEGFFGHAPAAIFGYSHIMGGYAGGQAEYVRVPFADVGPFPVPDNLTDEQVLFLTDIYPTGYQAAENCQLKGGEVVAVWGCGPVGLFAMRSAWLQGAERVIAIDRFPKRLEMASTFGKAEVINYEEENVLDRLSEMTGGRGPDACIEAVGMEAHGMGAIGALDRAKQELNLQTGRPIALREAILACRKGGNLSVAGVFGGFIDSIPMGASVNKGLTWKMGQTHVHRYLEPLLKTISEGDVDPSLIITHRMSLDEAPEGYKKFRDKQDGCVKVVLQP